MLTNNKAVRTEYTKLKAQIIQETTKEIYDHVCKQLLADQQASQKLAQDQIIDRLRNFDETLQERVKELVKEEMKNA